MPPMKRLAGKTMEHDIARARVYLKGGAAGNYPTFVTPTSEINVGSQVYSPVEWFGAKLTDNEDHEGYALFMSPVTGTITLTPVIELAGSLSDRNIRCKTSQSSAGDGEAVASTTTGFETVAVAAAANTTAHIYVLSQSLSFSATAGDFIQAAFYRDGNSLSDTIEASVWLFGFEVSYA